MTGQDVPQGATDGREFWSVEPVLRVGGRIAPRQQQRVAVAQRHVEALGQAQDHLARRLRPPGLDEAQMARGDLGRDRLANLDASHAGAASGVLSTALQVGGTLGIALIGVVYFGALPTGGFAHAFTVSLLAIAVPTVATAVLAQLLPQA